MSRVGRQPIPLPPQAKVEIHGSRILLEGPKGRMEHELPAELAIEQAEGSLRIKRSGNEVRAKSLHGLHRTLVSNMLKGVTDGFSKELELSGVGYKAEVTGNKLQMFVGLTHPVVYAIPAGIAIDCPKPTQLIVRGIDKQLVGQVAARIRAFAVPEPYKGKGIKYAGEVIRRKAGKAVA